MKSTLAVIAMAISIMGFGQSGDDIIQKHLEATGGEKWGQLESLIYRSTMDVNGTLINFTRTSAAPNKYHSDVQILDPNMRIIDAFDGKVGWTKNLGHNGVRRVPKEKEKRASRGQIGNGLWNYQTHGWRAQYEGEVITENTACYKVKLNQGEQDVFFYFSVVNYDLVKTLNITGPPGEGRMEYETVYSDVREIEGLRFAFSSQTRKNGEDLRTINYHEILINPSIDQKLFRMPVH